LAFFTASQITNHLALTHGRIRFHHLPSAKRRAASGGRNSDTQACHVVGTCVIKRTFTVSEDQICRVSQIRRREGRSVRAAHVFDRGEYQVTAAHFVCTGFSLGHVFIVLLLSFRLFEAISPVWMPFLSRSTLWSSCAVRARRLACMAAGRIRAKICGGLNYLVRDAEIRNCPRR
jgi:hypothetical protein